jgi:hypothetical protein
LGLFLSTLPNPTLQTPTAPGAYRETRSDGFLTPVFKAGGAGNDAYLSDR